MDERIWVAKPPAGYVSTGPIVIYDLSKYGVDHENVIKTYELNGFTLTEYRKVEEDERA